MPCSVISLATMLFNSLLNAACTEGLASRPWLPIPATGVVSTTLRLLSTPQRRRAIQFFRVSIKNEQPVESRVMYIGGKALTAMIRAYSEVPVGHDGDLRTCPGCTCACKAHGSCF